MRDVWPLLINDGVHEAQTRELLDLLSEIYGDEFALGVAERATEIAVSNSDSQTRVIYAFQALGWDVPQYVRDNHQELLRTGREPTTSGQRLLAKRVRRWYEKWSR